MHAGAHVAARFGPDVVELAVDNPVAVAASFAAVVELIGIVPATVPSMGLTTRAEGVWAHPASPGCLANLANLASFAGVELAEPQYPGNASSKLLNQQKAAWYPTLGRPFIWQEKKTCRLLWQFRLQPLD